MRSLRQYRTHILIAALMVVGLAGCQPISYRIGVLCPNRQSIYRDDNGSDESIAYALAAAEEACGESLADLDEGLKREVARWRPVRVKELGTLLTAEPWSLERESELASRSASYHRCEYDEYSRYGRWLISFKRARSYCITHLTIKRDPAPDLLYPGRFGLFLLTHPGMATLPYLVPCLLILAPLVLEIMLLARRRELRKALWPSQVSLVVTLVCACVVLPISVNDPPLVVVSYLVVGLARWRYLRRKASSATEAPAPPTHEQ